MLSNNKALLEALKHKDRDKLLQDNQALFSQLKKEYDITHFYFHLPNRVNLLRVHFPQRNSDIINRFTMLEAQKTGKIASGIELGPLGTLTLRVVQPVIYEQKLIGYLELGKEMEDILTNSSPGMDINLAIALDKKNISRAKWEDGMKMLGRDANWSRYKKRVLSYASSSFPKILDKLVFESKHIHNKGTEISSNSKDYYLLHKALLDVSGKEVGDYIFYYDTTKEIKNLKQNMMFIFGIFIVVFILLLSILSLIIFRNEKKLYDYQNSLDQKIKEAVKENTIQQQAKLAQMGEMISMIAHQWRQPLGAISAHGDLVFSATDGGSRFEVIL